MWDTYTPKKTNYSNIAANYQIGVESCGSGEGYPTPSPSLPGGHSATSPVSPLAALASVQGYLGFVPAPPLCHLHHSQTLNRASSPVQRLSLSVRPGDATSPTDIQWANSGVCAAELMQARRRLIPDLATWVQCNGVHVNQSLQRQVRNIHGSLMIKISDSMLKEIPSSPEVP